MPRGKVTAADLALIGECAANGVSVSAYQLERWRSAGVLPKPIRRGLGRGRGSTSTYPPDALEIALRLGREARQGRSLHDSVLVAFYFEAPIPLPALEAALRWQQRKIRARYRRIRKGGSAAEAAEIARTQRVMERWRRVTTSDVGVRSLPAQRRKVRAAQRSALRDAAADIVFLNIDNSTEGIGPDVWANAAVAFGMPRMADQIRTSLIEAELRGESFRSSRRIEDRLLTRQNLRRMSAVRSTLALWGAANLLLEAAVALETPGARMAAELLDVRVELRWYRALGPPTGVLARGLCATMLVLASDPSALVDSWRWAAWTMSSAYRALCSATARSCGPDRVAAVWMLADQVSTEAMGNEPPERLNLPDHVVDAVARSLALTSYPEPLQVHWGKRTSMSSGVQE